MLRYVRCIILFTLVPIGLFAQSSRSAYERITDPFAIARLRPTELAPLRSVVGYGFGLAKDSANPGFYVQASDTGSGVITHLFMISRTPDKQTRYRIVIDGTVLRDASRDSLFGSITGDFAPPLDTINGEARICDVQIPYRKSFKILYRSPDIYNWYDYVWRPTPGQSFNASEAQQAIGLMRRPQTLWKGFGTADSSVKRILRPNDSIELKLNGSLVVTALKLSCQQYRASLDSVVLEAYYDDLPEPALSASLLSLFGQSYSFRPIHCVAMDFSQDSGYVLRLPIPVLRSLRFVLRNRSSDTQNVNLSVASCFFPVAANDLGYLHAASSITPWTQYHVYHPVLHTTGRGRYVGLLMGIPNLTGAQTYEGDAFFDIDHDSRFALHYGGTEDYFDGAMYFSYGDCGLPFGGAPDHFANYYRFHYFDAFDFRSSFDFNFQHGNDNDCPGQTYRTLAFWYQEPAPFWTNCDTVRSRQSVQLYGVGYDPRSAVAVRLDTTTIDSFGVDASGRFARNLIVPAVAPARYTLSVGASAAAHMMTICDHPTLRIVNLRDGLAIHLYDTLQLEGAGYIGNDSITVRIGDVVLRSICVADMAGRLKGTCVVPDLPTGNYQLQLEGITSGRSDYSQTFTVQRAYKFECEEMISNRGWYQSLCGLLDFWCGSHAVFSDSGVSDVHLRFRVAAQDTFQTSVWLVAGRTFGTFDIGIDGKMLAHTNAYDTAETLLDSVGLGRLTLDSGYHTLDFHPTGKDPRANDSMLWADALYLTPVSAPPNLDTPLASAPNSICVYPNPASTLLHIEAPKTATCSIYDLLGVLRLRSIATNQPIMLDRLQPGLYLICIDAGDDHKQQRLIITY